MMRVPYTTRWSLGYIADMRERMERVADWIVSNGDPCIHMVLTAPGTGMTPQESVVKMSGHWRRLHEWLCRRAGRRFDYVWCVEPQERGHMHLHVIIVGATLQGLGLGYRTWTSWDRRKKRIVRRHMSDQISEYSAKRKWGKVVHCEPILPTARDHNAIDRACAYVTKYITKQSKDEVFASMLWWADGHPRHRRRTVGMSRTVSRVSSLARPPSTDRWTFLGAYPLNVCRVGERLAETHDLPLDVLLLDWGGTWGASGGDLIARWERAASAVERGTPWIGRSGTRTPSTQLTFSRSEQE